MARRNKKKNNEKRRAARRSLPLSNSYVSPFGFTSKPPARRNWDPGASYPGSTTNRQSRKVYEAFKTIGRVGSNDLRSSRRSQVPGRDWVKSFGSSVSAELFGTPKRDNSICSTRQARKEVIFANGKNGKRGQKRPVWTNNSYVTCKGRK